MFFQYSLLLLSTLVLTQSSEIALTVPIQLDGRDLQFNVMNDGRSIEAQVNAFVKNHQVIKQDAVSLLNLVKSQLLGKREIILSVPVQVKDSDGSAHEERLEIFRSDDPQQSPELQVQRFLDVHNVKDPVGREQLKTVVLQRILEVEKQQQIISEQSSRLNSEEALFEVQISVDGNLFQLPYFEGQETVAVASAFCGRHMPTNLQEKCIASVNSRLQSQLSAHISSFADGRTDNQQVPAQKDTQEQVEAAQNQPKDAKTIVQTDEKTKSEPFVEGRETKTNQPKFDAIGNVRNYLLQEFGIENGDQYAFLAAAVLFVVFSFTVIRFTTAASKGHSDEIDDNDEGQEEDEDDDEDEDEDDEDDEDEVQPKRVRFKVKGRQRKKRR